MGDLTSGQPGSHTPSKSLPRFLESPLPRFLAPGRMQRTPLEPEDTHSVPLTHDIQRPQQPPRMGPLPFPTWLEGRGQFLPSPGTLCILCLRAKSLPSLSLDKSKSLALKNSSSRKSLPHSTRACQLYLIT
ncbi:unnamed protein product [Rangifer tarandus platyrhynchus]|uniref:Uncharacterized protein n=2 Tax=Rangifer tarandus platyrhynchus TaxID=3082113 RepID=A0ABN8Y2E6_RANTA|nr:unnamed protein product [Rangifer tarandus platyrhynchus]